jgi:hypothetical protein
MENKYNTEENSASFKIHKSSKNSQVYLGAFIIIAGMLLIVPQNGAAHSPLVDKLAHDFDRPWHDNGA